MFMYESTLTRRPLYSVSPHFRRMITGSLILNCIAEGELDWFLCLVVSACVCRDGKFRMGERRSAKKGMWGGVRKINIQSL